MKHQYRRNNRARGLRVEQLESRRMLAGNVSASRQGDTLFIRGDDAGNEVAIISAGGDDYTVIGVDTTVNGNGERTFFNIRNLNIDLRGGNDVLSIADDPTGLLELSDALAAGFPLDLSAISPTTETFLDGYIIIRTGAGSDTVGLSVDTGSFVDIATGSGNDEVGILDSSVGAHLFLRTEDGADSVAVIDTFVETTTLVETGRGLDEALFQTFDADSLTVNGGRDRDFLILFDLAVEHAIVLIGDHGNDVINLEFAEASFVHVIGGDGNDEIDVDGVESFGDVIITAGNGNDDVEVEPNDEYVEEGVEITSIGGALVIDGGSGNDSLEAELVEARFLTIIGAGGNDDLNADGVNVENHVIMLGGSGSNFVDVGLSDDDEFEPGIASEIGSFLHVITGGGADEVFIIDVFVGGHILLDAGGGNDLAEISAAEVNDHVLVLMGSGDDELTYLAVLAGGDETLDGGPGFDSLLIDFRNGRRIRNFENIELDIFEPEPEPDQT